MALTSITMVTGANIISGRAMARNGALTLDANHIVPPVGACTLGSGGGGTGGGRSGGAGGPGSGGTSGPVPVPGTGAGGTGLMIPALMLITGGASIEAARRSHAGAAR
jgi:hypothetical protein